VAREHKGLSLITDTDWQSENGAGAAVTSATPADVTGTRQSFELVLVAFSFVTSRPKVNRLATKDRWS
jgi:hypothetical protein